VRDCKFDPIKKRRLDKLRRERPNSISTEKMTEEPEKTWVLDLIESKKPTSTSCSSSLAY